MSSGDLGGLGLDRRAGPAGRDGEIASDPNLPPGRGSCRGGLGEAEADRDRSRLDAARHPELGEDVANVDADGLLADEEALPDLAVRPTLGDQDEDLALPPRQPERVTPGRRRLPDDAPDERRPGCRPIPV